MSNITINIDGEIHTVPRALYAKAKMKQMVEFGYTDLTLEQTDAQIQAVLDGKTMQKGLDTIGRFMEREIVRDSK